jgi:hypothetical protein
MIGWTIMGIYMFSVSYLAKLGAGVLIFGLFACLCACEQASGRSSDLQESVKIHMQGVRLNLYVDGDYRFGFSSGELQLDENAQMIEAHGGIKATLTAEMWKGKSL